MLQPRRTREWQDCCRRASSVCRWCASAEDDYWMKEMMIKNIERAKTAIIISAEELAVTRGKIWPTGSSLGAKGRESVDICRFIVIENLTLFVIIVLAQRLNHISVLCRARGVLHRRTLNNFQFPRIHVPCLALWLIRCALSPI